jgi:enoyl-CoA hydratase/carnithine racemase
MNKSVIIEKKQSYLELCFNRPAKKNALTLEMYALLNKGLQMADEDSDVRVVLIKSNGDSFTSGNDLNDFSAIDENFETDLGTSPVEQFIDEVIKFSKPLVASVKGAAIGIGTTLLLHCDSVIAAPSTRFAFPFTRLGLVPEFASSFLLPLAAGKVLASHYLLSGLPFDVSTAERMGIVSVRCEEAELEEKSIELVRHLASLPPEALTTTKRLINSSQLNQQIRKCVVEETEHFRLALKSHEHREALNAFFKKSKT